MEIVFILAFATTGALWMKKNGLSWVEGALWGGVLTVIGIVVIYFRIRAAKKKPMSIDKSDSAEEFELENEESIQISLLLRQGANKQILFGLAWWSASAIAMYVALQSTGSTVLWFGGALGALFHWYRAYKIFELSRKSRLKIFIQNDYILIAVTLVIAIGSFSKIVPEYIKIDTPSLGTCWAGTGLDLYTPIACWADTAEVKAVSFATTAEACGTDSFFKPTGKESRYTCLEDLNVDKTNA